MPNQTDFFEFLRGVGVDEETGDQLWNGMVFLVVTYERY